MRYAPTISTLSYLRTTPRLSHTRPFRFHCLNALSRISRLRKFSISHPSLRQSEPQPPLRKPATGVRENIYTIPNFLTASRIAACPVLGWCILDGNFSLATSLLVYAGLTDLVCALL